MEGVTDRAFRGTVRALGGCGLSVTEFISSEAMTRDVRDAWRMAEVDPDEHPVSIQIYGRDPERMAQAARHCASVGADIVDINLGCPSKRVTSGCAGSALMREPALASEIFDAVRGAIRVPMTVKMRLGWDHASLNAPEIAARAVDAGASMVAVHGRTKSDGYKGRARWDLVGEVKRAVSVPVLVNGDIVDPASARDALAASGCDGVMIGRGVMTDPWTLARVTASLRSESFVEPTLACRRALLLDYLARLEDEDLSGSRALGRLRRVLGYFSKGMYNASGLRRDTHGMRSLSEARERLDAFFEEAMEASLARESMRAAQ